MLEAVFVSTSIPPVGVAQVWSPRKNVDEFAVPDARRAVATVPLLIFEAFTDVIEEPFAVITFALKFPEASLATIVDAPFEDEAVVRALSNDPDEMLEALIPVIEEPFAVMTFALKFPEASLATIVEAPFEDEAVVLSFDKVPLETFEALRLVTPEPSPIKSATTRLNAKPTSVPLL